MAHPNGDIAPGDAAGCHKGGDGVVNVQDLLALLSSWGPCESANDECPKVLDPTNAFARITANGIYPFRLNGVLDGPQRGPTNDLGQVFTGVSIEGWKDYGANGIEGTYWLGDQFGIDMTGMSSDWVIGGDAWFLYTPPCNGTAFFSTQTDCSPGLINDTIIEIYESPTCPTAWQEMIAIDDASSPDCGEHAFLTANVLQSKTYLIRLGGILGERGDGELTVINCIDNSICENALPFTIDSSIQASTIDANMPIVSPCTSPEVRGPGRWYTVVGNGRILTATSCDSDLLLDTRISVFCSADGTCSTLTCLASVDDNSCSLDETLSWCSVAGQMYYILVYGNPDVLPPFVSEGKFRLEVSNGTFCNPPTPCN